MDRDRCLAVVDLDTNAGRHALAGLRGVFANLTLRTRRWSFELQVIGLHLEGAGTFRAFW